MSRQLLAGLIFCGFGCGSLRRPQLPMALTDAAPQDARLDEIGDAGSSRDAFSTLLPDGSMCPPDQTPPECLNPIGSSDDCLDHEECGEQGSGNGLDDNCDGTVDELCNCTPGDVESCFVGLPGKHKVGACSDGKQTCEFSGEFAHWGACIGSIGPSVESCDKLDNDCNGCPDDGLCCTPPITCPAPGDPRIVAVQPYTDVALHGGDYFPSAAQSWSWTITGGPCDRLFASPQSTPQPDAGAPPPQSFTLSRADTEDATAHFTLSGDYTVTLTVVGAHDERFTCTWVQHVEGPGVRIELCWDHTGPGIIGGADIDLHVHKPGSTAPWFDKQDDCFYGDCRYALMPWWPVIQWYSPSTASACTSAACYNPRLDIDNVFEIAKPENTNIDQPQNGETFRVMVHYYGGWVTEHPLVNIYCAGVLKTTFGQTPNQVSGFTTGMQFGKGQFWRVADVAAVVDNAGNTTDCHVTALHDPITPTRYWVTPPSNLDISY